MIERSLAKKLSDTLRAALLAGGTILRRGFAGPRRVTFKSSSDPVTQIDLASERAIIGLIRRRFPSHVFLAEESAYQKKNVATESHPDRFRWIIDPLDGTVNYLHRIPHACVSIAVERGGTILAGGVYDPFRDELFFGQPGRGATLNGRRIRVSMEKRLSRSLIITGFPYDHRQNAAFHTRFIAPFLKHSMDLRRLGSAALDLAWIACGRSEGYFEFKLRPWDMAAGGALVEEAGGRMSDFRGRPINVNAPYQTMASNGRIHAEMIRLFRRAGGG